MTQFKCTHCSESECESGAACDKNAEVAPTLSPQTEESPAAAVGGQRTGRAPENCS